MSSKKRADSPACPVTPARTELQVRVLLFLMHGSFSIECLRILVASNTDICGLVLPKNSTHTGEEIPVFMQKPVLEIAQENNIPVLQITGTGNPSLVHRLSRLRPDYILVACFPFLIPESIRSLAKHGAYNLHPSMLPDYKGPTPLFWQFYYGEKNTGVTLHVMTDEIDSGPIIAQTQVPFPDGMTSDEASILLAREGGNLAIRHIQDMENHTDIKEHPNCGGRYYHWPGSGDFSIDTNWTGKRIYNFVHGTSHWNQPYKLELGNRLLLIRDVISYSGQRYSSDIHTEGYKTGINLASGSILVELA